MAQPQLSFGRTVKIQVFATTESITPGSSETFVNYSGGYTEFASVQNAVPGVSMGTPGFRIKGRVTQVAPTVGIGTNPITFSIYNLGQDSRNILQGKVGTKIKIFAGYGTAPKQIATGDILWSKTYKSGTDYITDVIAGDSHFALANGEINTSFAGSTTFKQVVNVLMDALSDVGMFVGTQIIPEGGYNNGIVLTGSPLTLLADICKKMNCVCYVIANQVNILPDGADVGLPTIDVNQGNGLIGIPEIHPPGVIGVIPNTVPVSPQLNLSFKVLMTPDLTIFRKVNIKSKFVNGIYIVNRVMHDFDSWEGPFYTECEAFQEPSNG